MPSLAKEENATNPVLLQLILDVAFPRSGHRGCKLTHVFLVCQLSYNHPILFYAIVTGRV